MDIFDSYATNSDAEESGRLFENGDSKFRIARSGNSRYQAMVTVQFEAHKTTLDKKSTEAERKASEACAEKIMVDVMAKSILLGWEGTVSFKGEKLEFNVTNARRLLEVKDFRGWVNGKADNFKNYLEKVIEEDEKNSLPSSNGSSPGAAA